MEIEILISAMNLKNESEFYNLINNANITTRALLINQITKEGIEPLDIDDGKYRMLSFKEKGLSKSRNKAIKNAVGDIGVLCDDDVIYLENYAQIIQKGYEENPDADIIAFYIESTNPNRPTRHLTNGEVDFERSLKICSCSITVKLESLKKYNLSFNELFGAGAKYYMGEENIFLANALSKGMKIVYIDEKMADVIQEDSTWYGTFDEQYFNLRGAVYYELNKEKYMDLILDFAKRKIDLYKDNLTYDQALNAMIKGANDYIELKK